GGSPYRALFPNATYHRADYVRVAGIDFQISEEGQLPGVKSGVYDMVISTQVLEHVTDPRVYLKESWRVLKAGGALLLATHGSFPDHGCPNDFWRWTADGLRTELARAGFSVRKLYRLTCGVRAVLFWLGQACYIYPARSASFKNFLLRILRRIYRENSR